MVWVCFNHTICFHMCARVDQLPSNLHICRKSTHYTTQFNRRGLINTPLKINMEHNSLEVWLEDHFSFLDKWVMAVAEPAVISSRGYPPISQDSCHEKRWDTLPKFNIAPEKWWLEDYFPIGKVTLQGRTVKLWGGSLPIPPIFVATLLDHWVPQELVSCSAHMGCSGGSAAEVLGG